MPPFNPCFCLPFFRSPAENEASGPNQAGGTPAGNFPSRGQSLLREEQRNPSRSPTIHASDRRPPWLQSQPSNRSSRATSPTQPANSQQLIGAGAQTSSLIEQAGPGATMPIASMSRKPNWVNSDLIRRKSPMVLQDVRTRNNFADLLRYAVGNVLSIEVIDVVPNMLPLPWGGTARAIAPKP
jgi:hypothetical protein